MKRTLALTLTLLLPAAAQGADGATLYAQSCARCHGPNGDGGKGPPLTELSAEDFAARLSALTDRSHAGLSDDQIQAIADWLASLS